ncbi:MAG: fatty acid desaturase [Saprospirales bacterium]|nr:fatty acid desaturase [Saprospirales bacterium]MBK8920852.1 fatty acid desaturase [Saprospirales bacterium]
MANTLPVQDETVLKQLPLIVKPYQLPNTRKAVFQILNTLTPFLGLWAAIFFLVDSSIWLAAPLFLVNGFFLGRLFILQHDCGHQSFTASRQANYIIGNFLALLTCIPFKYWASSHNFHHGHNNLLWKHRDIGDIPTLTVAEFRKINWLYRILYMTLRNGFVLFILLPPVYVFFNNRFPLVWLKSFAHARRSLLRSTALLAAFYALIYLLLGWKGLIIQFALVWIFGSYALWFFYVQHQHESTYKQWRDRWDYVRAAIQGSSFYKLPRVLNWLTGNIGYHHIHHLNPLVPNYELVRCHRENPILDQLANKLTLWQSFRCLFNKLWDEEQQRMISFREYFRRYERRLA